MAAVHDSKGHCGGAPGDGMCFWCFALPTTTGRNGGELQWEVSWHRVSPQHTERTFLDDGKCEVLLSCGRLINSHGAARKQLVGIQPGMEE